MTLTDVLQLVRCPKSGAVLIHEGNRLISSAADCRLSYEIRDDIPVLIPEEGTELSVADWSAIMQRHGQPVGPVAAS